MAEQTLTQKLRASVKLVKPELLASVPSDYGPRQTFNFLRHRATNYDELLEQHRQRYGNVAPAENKALTQGAADVIIQAFRAENIDLIAGKANTPFAKFTQALANLLGLNPDIDFQAIHKATAELKRSRAQYKSWNERYRRQREMVLKVVKAADIEIQKQVKAIYQANSKATLDALQEKLFESDTR